MKRGTLKPLRPKPQPVQHHNVYVVLLDPAVGKVRKVRATNPKRDPKKPCIYVGMTGLTPEERFTNHKSCPTGKIFQRINLFLYPNQPIGQSSGNEGQSKFR